MAFFNKFFKHTTKPTNYCPTSPAVTPPVSKTGYFEFNEDAPLTEGDSYYRKASFCIEEDGSGVVYFDFAHARVKIGSFQKDTATDRVLALRESDDEEIAFCDSEGYLYLSRAGMHNASLKRGWSEPFPNPLFQEIGRCMGDDHKGVFYSNGSIIGSYQGNRSAAAATLACIIYELHLSSWHQFYSYI